MNDCPRHRPGPGDPTSAAGATSGTTTAIPAPARLPVLGHAHLVRGEGVIDSIGRLASTHGPIFRLKFPKFAWVVIANHALTEEVCNERRFAKAVHGPLIELRDAVGDALFTAETADPVWETAHRALTPAFGQAAIAGYFDAMRELAAQLVARWVRRGPEAVLDVPQEMTNLTLDTIALTAFDMQLNSIDRDVPHPFVTAMVSVLRESGARVQRPDLINALWVPKRRAYARDIAAMHALTRDVVAARRAAMTGEVPYPRDILQRLLDAGADVSDTGLSEANIGHQLVTLLIAGHETTSGLLSYAVYRLLSDPGVHARAQAEVDTVLGDREPAFADMGRLVYVEQLLKETLRLHPTAPAFALTPLTDTTLGGRYAVRAGEVLLIHLPSLHSDPEVWPDPTRFDPDRFARGALVVPRTAWMPFGYGRRACIGRGFAMQEAKLLVAMLLQRFDLSFAEPYRLRNVETLTIKPLGLRVRAKPRSTEHRGTRFAAPPTRGA